MLEDQICAVQPHSVQHERVTSLSKAEREKLLDQKKQEAKAFERKLLTSKEMGILEEKYYEHQL